MIRYFYHIRRVDAYTTVDRSEHGASLASLGFIKITLLQDKMWDASNPVLVFERDRREFKL